MPPHAFCRFAQHRPGLPGGDSDQSQMLKMILTMASPQMGETPLLRSAHNGHFQTVKFLVEQGADVNAVDLVRRGGRAPCPLAAPLRRAASSARGGLFGRQGG